MHQYLLIVESPAKCKKIEEFLGKDYKCLASYGHICSLDNLDNIDFDEFENNRYTQSKQKYKQIQALKLETNNVGKDNVIIATDNDREGEAIGFHLCRTLKLDITKTKRIIFNEITKPSIVNALKSHTLIDLSLVHAQQTRQIIDLMIGYKLSPYIWKFISPKGSVGRCQTPALKMLLENETRVRELWNKTNNVEYLIHGIFGDKQMKFELTHRFHGDKSENNVEEFLKSCFEHDFILDKDSVYEKEGPLVTPFITTTLQGKCNEVYGMSSKQVMSCAQKLYENGYITYMRTDSTAMSSQFISSAKQYVENTHGSTFVSSNTSRLSKNFKNKHGNAQEAHECIRCSDINKESVTQGFGEDCARVYKIIRDNNLKCMMKRPIYYCLDLHIQAPLQHLFKATVKKDKFLGYNILKTSRDKYENIDSEKYEYFNHLSLPSRIEFSKIYSTVTKNTSLSLMNDVQLIKKLEKVGIGRPSTYSNIVNSLEDKKFVSREKKIILSTKTVNEFYIDKHMEVEEVYCDKKDFKHEEYNKFVVTDTGKNVVKFCNEYFNSIFEYDYTKRMETDLDKVASGTLSKPQLCHLTNTSLSETILYTEENTSSLETFKQSAAKNRINICKYQNKSIYLCKGQYGYYLEWNKEKVSISHIIEDTSVDIYSVKSSLTLEIMSECIERQIEKRKSNIIRELDSNTSIRNGKYGEYIFYQTKQMKKPRFIALKTFPDELDYHTCDVQVLLDFVSQNVSSKPKSGYKRYKRFKK